MNKKRRYVFEHYARTHIFKYVLTLNEKINWRGCMKRGLFTDVVYI